MIADMFFKIYEEWCNEKNPEKITRIWFGENIVGFMTNIQMYSRLLSNQEMQDITTCKLFIPGDYISWQSTKWKTNNLGINAPTKIKKIARQRSILSFNHTNTQTDHFSLSFLFNFIFKSSEVFELVLVEYLDLCIQK